MKNCFTILFTLVNLWSGINNNVAGQVTGVKVIPGDYSTLAHAVTELNTVGVGAGGATIELRQSEEAPPGGYLLGSTLLNASLSAANPLVINGNGNTLTAFTGTNSNTDGIFKILGADYVTIDALNLAEKSTNTNATTRMEWGYALLKLNAALPYDGCQYVIIRNCSIELNYTSGTVIGIRSTSHQDGVTTALPAAGATAADANSYNSFYGNTITGVQWGIQVMGLGNAAVYDVGNTVGVPAGNHITVGIASGTGSSSAYGIYCSNNTGATVHNNILRTTSFQRGQIDGIMLEGGNGAVSIRDNDISFKAASAFNNSIYGFRNQNFSDMAAAMHISGNIFHGWENPSGTQAIPIHNNSNAFDSIVVSENVFDKIVTGSHNLQAINLPAGGTRYVEVRGNRMSDLSKAGTAGSITLINVSTSQTTSRVLVRDNDMVSIENNTNNAGFNYSIIGIQASTAGGLCSVSNNTMSDFTSYRNNVTTAISVNSTNQNSTVDSNTIEDISTETGDVTAISARVGAAFGNVVRGVTTLGGTIKGYAHLQGGAIRLYDNLFTGLRNNGTSGLIRVVDLHWARASSRLYNNIIEVSVGNGFEVSDISLFVGIHANQSQPYAIFHNTIKMSGGAPAANSCAAGIWAGAGTRLDLRNNIIHVDVEPAGTPFTAAIYQNTTGTPPTANLSGDGNIYYVPSVSNSFYYANNTAASRFGPFNDPAFNKPCGLYKAFMGATREQNSYVENNLVAGSIPGSFLPSGASFAKGGGVLTASPAVTTDFAGAARPNPGSDAGALQFVGTPADITAPVIAYDPFPALSCDTVAPVLKAEITDNISVATTSGSAPRLYFRKSGEANAFGAYPADNVPAFNGWKYVEGTSLGGDTFYFKFDYNLLTAPIAAGDEIQYFVIAQDGAGNAAANTVGFPSSFCMGGVNLTAAAGPVAATPAVNRFTIQDDPRQSLTPAGPVSLCGGNAVDLEVPAPGVSHNWYRNDTLIAGAGGSVYRVDSAGMYHAFVVTASCFYTTTATELSVGAKPLLHYTGSLSFCPGDTTILYTDSTATGRSYSWLAGGNLISGASHASLPVTTAGDYQVIISGGGCTDTSLGTVIQVLSPPSVGVTTSTGDTFFCARSSIDLQATAGQASYRWKKDGLDIATGGTTPVYTATEPGLYQVVVSAGSGCTDSSALLSIISDTAHATVTMSGSNTVCSNDSLELHAPQVSGYSYEWKRNGVVLPATGPSLTAKESGAYKVIVTTAYGCIDSSSATSLVVDTAGATVTASGPLTFCKGDSVLLAAPVATGYTYVWKKDGVALAFTGSTLTAKESGAYKVIVTTPNSCVDSSSAVQVVSDTAQAIVTHATPLVFCKEDSVVLSAQQRAGYTYAWLKDGAALSATTPNYAGKQTGAYQLIVISANNCRDTSAGVQLLSDTVDVTVIHNAPLTFCRADSVVLQAPVVSGYAYAWYRNGVAQSGTARSFAAKHSGAYRVVITSANNCVDSSSIFTVISDTANVTLTASGPLTFCAGDSVQFTALSGFGYSYAWYRDGAAVGAAAHSYTAKSSGDYEVVITTGNNCADTSARYTVISDTAVAAVTFSGPLIFCDGDSVILEATSFPNYSYTWFHNGAAISGALSNRYTATLAGDYETVVTTLHGCYDTSGAATVVVNTMPVATLTLEGDSVFCSGNTAVLSTTSGPGYTWQWRRNGQDILNAHDSFYTVQFSGNYDVIVSAGNSCEDTSEVREIVVIPSPVPGIIAVDPRMKTGGHFVTYQWYRNGQPVDGATDSVFTASETGAYTVEVTDSSGCSGMSVVYNLTTMNYVDVADPEWLAAQIRIYPNPASSFVRIDAPVAVHVRVYGMDGKMVLRQQDAQEVQLEALPDGVYMMDISNEDGVRIRAERIMKVSR